MNNKEYDRLFWEELERLVKECGIIIDRPRGTEHPRFKERIYPVDYGCLRETSSMDGGGIDIWVGTKEPKKVDAVLCTIDMLKR